jgi:hypothetical protein
MKNLLLLMLIPLIGIAQTPSSLALNGHLATNTEDKMLLLKNPPLGRVFKYIFKEF